MIYMVKKLLSGFPPIIGNKPIVLILGSMPSVTSLEKQEYYGFKHNRFWKVMSYIFECDLKDYEDKKQLIQDYHIILWDVIATCVREGSLDSNIKEVTCNNIEALLINYPTIEKVICNGKKSQELFLKHFSHLNIQCIYLPSTSNANRSIKEVELFDIWKKELVYLRFNY